MAPRRDFSTSRQAIVHSCLAVAIGGVVTVVAVGLMALVGIVTHLAYTGRFATSLEPPDTSVLGPLSVLVPVAGGLIVGLMAKVGSERIRGHGIPEAIETILLRGSRMEPRLAVLKPISSAISIGTGGPFGAEGPIIVTGGALGSITGQLFHLTSAERRVLLVAGAAAGMTAVFGTPLSAVLLSVELLLFEWRPRSFVPVAMAACTAASLRTVFTSTGLLRATPLFAVPNRVLGANVTIEAVLIGVGGAVLAWLATRCVYGAEDAFGRLPLHWAWWPALGGVAVGVGGLIDPRALGVGYDTIGLELAGHLALGALVLLLLTKLAIWSIALGSNTSGGVLAPLLMLGAAVGAIIGSVLPGADAGTWAMIGMAAAMAATMRSPLTAIVFAIELTHDLNALTALVAACAVAHLLSVLTLPRSILTEKIARRGFHVTREYQLDPLQALLVRDVMLTDPFTAAPDANAADAVAGLGRQRLLPITHPDGSLIAVAPASALDEGVALRDVCSPAIVAHADETLREAADRMVSSGHHVLPVLENGVLVGLVSETDLLRAHERVLIEERHRQRGLVRRG